MSQDTAYAVCSAFVGSSAPGFPWFGAIGVFLIGVSAGILLVVHIGITPDGKDLEPKP